MPPKPTRKKTAKRNPNDSTFRNINALKRRVKQLEIAMNILGRRVHLLALKGKT